MCLNTGFPSGALAIDSNLAASLRTWEDLRRHAQDHGLPMAGFHNRNHAIRLPEELARAARMDPGATVKLRIPLGRDLGFDQAIWPQEAEVLRAVSAHLPNVPRVLAEDEGYSIQTYAEGQELPGSRRSRPVTYALASCFARLAEVPVGDLPTPPADWPESPDSTAFLHRLVRYTQEEVEAPAHRRYGSLFAELRFPADAMARFGARITRLTPRPFVLLHADLHPGNLIWQEPALHIIDWELAMVGDPLHDLAIHLCRTNYPSQRGRQRLVAAWLRAVREAHREAVRGYRRDLHWYLDYQRVRSVYTDVIRAAERLREDPTEDGLKAAARTVERVLAPAWEPIGLSRGGRAPAELIAKALRNWRDGDGRPETR